MQTIFSFTLVAAAALAGVEAATSSEGCFSSSTGLVANGTLTFNSVGSCNTVCTALGDSVFAMQSSVCYCGNELPPASTKTDDGDCIISCPGYPSDKCGGSGLWSVYLTGLVAEALLSNAPAAASDTSAASSASAKATTKAASATATPTVNVVTTGGQTVYVTATGAAAASSTSTSSTKSSGPSMTGIAVGVVIGIVVIAAVSLGLFFFIRNKRRREVEEEYRRNAAVSSFISGGKPPGSSGGNSFADTRLEPAIMANRRMSDGSIADNQDYSRRILKVTNA